MDAVPVVARFSSVSLSIDGRPVLHDLSAHVKATGITCLCGQNGAGKTMAIRVLLGLEKPSSGAMELLGDEPQRTRLKVGYLPQQKNFSRRLPCRVDEFVSAGILCEWPFLKRRSVNERMEECLGQVGALPWRQRQIQELSGGQLQRVFLAHALARQPKFLVLDEPLAALDSGSREAMLEIFQQCRAAGLPLLLVTHSEAVVKLLADEVILLEHGHLQAQTSAAAIAADQHLKRLAFGSTDHEHSASHCHGE